MPAYTIRSVEQGKDYTFQGDDGEVTMRPWNLALDNGNGELVIAQMNQKPETAAPVVGETLDGDVSDSSYGKRFKKARKGGGGGGGWKPMDPAQIAAIQRQHSQEMSIRYAAVLHSAGKLPADFNLQSLTVLIDWFEADIRKGVPAAAPAAPPAAVAPPVVATPAAAPVDPGPVDSPPPDEDEIPF